jgi:hypothetical protein
MCLKRAFLDIPDRSLVRAASFNVTSTTLQLIIAKQVQQPSSKEHNNNYNETIKHTTPTTCFCMSMTYIGTTSQSVLHKLRAALPAMAEEVPITNTRYGLASEKYSSSSRSLSVLRLSCSPNIAQKSVARKRKTQTKLRTQRIQQCITPRTDNN